MKIGLYFGSFNPVHIGHLIIAQYILDNSDVRQIWFVVSPQNPLKAEKTLLNEYDRLHLVRLAIDDNECFRVNDIEFRLPKPSYTINTLIHLQEKYPENEFSVILGSDSFLNLKNWKNYETLIKNYRFLVYERPGFLLDKNTINSKIKHQTFSAPLLDISATTIRNNLKEKKSVRYMLPEKVYEEIVRNNYYN